MNISWKCFLPNLLSFLRGELKKLETGGEATSAINFAEEVKTKCTLMASQLSDKVTMLLYIVSQPETPTTEVIGPILDQIEVFATELIYSFYSLPKTQGLTIRKQYHRDVIRVVQDLVGVLETLDKIEFIEQSSMRSAEYLCKSCGEFQLYPENNLEAVCRLVEAEESLVFDALHELTDAFESNSLDSSYEEGEMWNSEEMEILPPGIGLVKTARCLLKKIKLTLKNNGKCSTEQEITQLDNIASTITKFSPVIDDFASSLYPPIDKPACIQTSNDVLNQSISTLELIKNGHFMKEEDLQWHSFLRKAVEHNHKKLLASATIPTSQMKDMKLS